MPSADSFSSPGHDSRTGAATDTGSGIGSPAGADSGTPTTEIDWVTAFVDIPDAVHRICTEFWSSVTGSQLSASRGDHGQFATLLPDSGDAYLRVQNTGHGGTGVHIDLHVQDRPTMVGRVRALGGREHTDYGDVQVMTSPGGMRFCLVDASDPGRPPPPSQWSGHRSRVDQVVIDVSPDDAATERRFWTELTGWSPSGVAGPGPFLRLTHPDQPLCLLVQELAQPAPLTRAHLDLATSDVEAETDRHLRLGAKIVRRHPQWTVMAAPGGLQYCITARQP